MDGGWFVRDLAVTAVVFGVAAFVWFGWGQEDPPARWRVRLGVGSGLGLLVALAGGVLTWQNLGTGLGVRRGGDPARVRDRLRHRVRAGRAGCGGARRPEEAGVDRPVDRVRGGRALVPLAWIFRDPGLVVLAVLVVAAAVAAVALGGRLASSAVTGVGAGTALLAFGIRAAVLAATF